MLFAFLVRAEIEKRETSKLNEKRTRKTKAQVIADREQLEKISKFREQMLEQSKRAITLRSKDREFHGLNREFHYAQAQITNDYLESKDVKHPRDAGAVREDILRKFLKDGGFLPARYGISSNSFRAASTTGHLSQEIDIALYDPIDSISLMKRKDIYEVLPIESVFGAIQVKSRLSRAELGKALDNIASIKHLDPLNFSTIAFSGRPPALRAFGLIFAYETEMAWLDVVAELQAFADKNPQKHWPNALFILNVGMFVIGEKHEGHFHNIDLENVKNPVVHGRPDQGDLLFNFQSILLSLLRATRASIPPFDNYFQLPLIAGDGSYSFAMGSFAEIGKCSVHGDFARKIPTEKLDKLIAACEAEPPINWVRANDLGLGKGGDDDAAYERQPGDVRIYNPNKLPFPDILMRQSEYHGRKISSISYDIIQVKGMSIMLPYLYSDTEQIITGCPKCSNKSKVRK